MKNIAAVGVLERIRRLAPQGAVPPFRTTDEWREWQLAEGRKRSEEINRLNHQVRVEKILNRAGIQRFTGSAHSGTTGCRTTVSAML